MRFLWFNFDLLLLNRESLGLRDFGKDRPVKLRNIKGYAFLTFSSFSQIHQHPLPMVHVDAFLYDDDFLDTMCEEGRMSRNYCTECGSYKTASLGKCSFGNMRSEFCSTIRTGLCNDSAGQHNIHLMEAWCSTQASIISHNQ